MSSDSSILNRIRADLASIDDLAPPPTASTSADKAHALLADYAARREEYIHKKSLITFMNCVQENKAPECDPAVREQLKEQKQGLLSEFQTASEALTKTLIENEAKYAGLVQKRADLEDMLHDMSTRGVLDAVTEQDEVEVAEVDEAEMEQEQRRLDELQLKLTELRSKLHEKQHQHDQVRKRIQEKHKALRVAHPNLQLDANQLDDLRKQNEAILAPYNKLKANRDLFRAILSVQQALLGITLLNVTAAPVNVAADLLLTLRLLDHHEIQIGCVRVKAKHLSSVSDNIRPVFAAFSTDTVIRGPRLQFHHGNPVFQKEIPALDDLVRLSQNIADPTDAFHFLISETMARISTTRALVNEMSILEEELARDGVSSDYKFYTSESQYGDTEHNVSFEFNGMLVLLRLLTDCPKAMGSVLVEEIVAKETSGWKQSDLQHALQRINTLQFKRPVEIVRAIKLEVSKLVKSSSNETTPVSAEGRVGAETDKTKRDDTVGEADDDAMDTSTD